MQKTLKILKKSSYNQKDKLPKEDPRPLTNFSEKIGSVFEIKNFLLSLKALLPKKFKIGEILLFYESKVLGLRRAYIKNSFFCENSAKKIWPKTHTISLSNTEQNKYLANEFGKPFSKTLTIPFFIESQVEKPRSSLLFIEMSDWKKVFHPLTDFFQEQKSILNLIFKRALENTELNQISYLRSQLFLYWGEPLAILQNSRPLQKNHSFKKNISDTTSFFKHKKNLDWHQINGKKYKSYYYSISQFQPIKKTGILYLQDLTKDFELKEQLFQNKKMLSLHKLGKNMAHQLNNPLTGLKSMTQILQQRSDMQAYKEDLTEITKAINRTQDIIKNLLSFSKIQGNTQTCDLNEAVKSCLTLLKSQIRGIFLKTNISKQALEVKGELSLIQQVTYNLILNSCQALKEQNFTNPEIQIETKKNSKNQVQLKIKDNGCGIAKQNLEKIFQAFWTNKKSNQGTGLGLSISRKLIRQLGGDIFVSSQQKQGACFTVLLPLSV